MFHFPNQNISRHLFFLPVIFLLLFPYKILRCYWCCRSGPAPSAGGHTRPLHDLPQALLRVQLPRPPQQGPGPPSQTSRGETQPQVPHSSYQGLRIRIHLIWIRIQHFRLNTNPDPDPTDPIRIRIQRIQSVSGSNPDPGVLMAKNRKKITAENFFLLFFIKNYSLPIPRPP